MALQANAVGVKIRFLLLEADGSVLNLSSATLKQIVVVKPNCQRVVFNAEFVTDGSDGLIEYETTAGDINAVGSYKAQPRITMQNYDGFGSVERFDVLVNI